MIRRLVIPFLILMTAPVYASGPKTADVPSIPEADAPELAALGTYGIGFRSVLLTHRASLMSKTGVPAASQSPLLIAVCGWTFGTLQRSKRAQSRLPTAEVCGASRRFRQLISRKRALRLAARRRLEASILW